MMVMVLKPSGAIVSNKEIFNELRQVHSKVDAMIVARELRDKLVDERLDSQSGTLTELTNQTESNKSEIQKLVMWASAAVAVLSSLLTFVGQKVVGLVFH